MRVSSVTTRRRRTPYLTVAAAAAIALMAVASASATPAKTASPAAKVKPVKGGTVTIRSTATPDCLDPQRTSQSASFQIFDPIMDTLVRIDARGHYIPYLAQSWTIAKDGLQLTFKLRPGLKFSNGDPLNAAAVKWTFDRALNPATNSPVAGPQLAGVTQVLAVNNLTVRLVLKQPSRPLLANLSGAYLGILDPKYWAQVGDQGFCQNPIGSGPFKIQNIGPAFSSVTMVRNPFHHLKWGNNSGPAYLDKLVFKQIPSESTATSALISGDLDYENFDTSQYPRLVSTPGIITYRLPGTNEKWLGFNQSKPPFDDPQVRRAVAEVIDRATIVKVARGGFASVAWSAFPALMPYWSPAAKKAAAKYDPAAAKQFLCAKNLPAVDLTIGPVAADVPTAALIQSWLGDACLKVNIQNKDNAAYNLAAQTGTTNMWLNGWGCSDPDCLRGFFSPEQIGLGGTNFSHLNDSLLNSYFQQGLRATTDKAAAAAYEKAQVRIAQQTLVVPLYSRWDTFAVRSRVKGFLRSSIGYQIWQDLWVTDGK